MKLRTGSSKIVVNYNDNHDPETGRFMEADGGDGSGGGGDSRTPAEKALDKMMDADTRRQNAAKGLPTTRDQLQSPLKIGGGERRGAALRHDQARAAATPNLEGKVFTRSRGWVDKAQATGSKNVVATVRTGAAGIPGVRVGDKDVLAGDVVSRPALKSSGYKVIGRTATGIETHQNPTTGHTLAVKKDGTVKWTQLDGRKERVEDGNTKFKPGDITSKTALKKAGYTRMGRDGALDVYSHPDTKQKVGITGRGVVVKAGMGVKRQSMPGDRL